MSVSHAAFWDFYCDADSDDVSVVCLYCSKCCVHLVNVYYVLVRIMYEFIYIEFS